MVTVVPYPDLAIRLSALRELHDVDYAELAAVLKLDKTSVWRWFQGAANLPDAKQGRLVEAMCRVLQSKGVDLSEEDFRNNHTLEFLTKIGVPRLRAVTMCGISLSVPDSLIDAAMESRERLSSFLGSYKVYWQYSASSFALGWADIRKQNDGRVTFDVEWLGDGPFSIHGYLCMVGSELSVIGDRIAGDYTQTRSIFSMSLDVDFDARTKSVTGLRAFMPDRRHGEQMLRRIVMKPAPAWDMKADETTLLDAEQVKEEVGPRGLSFLCAEPKAV